MLIVHLNCKTLHKCKALSQPEERLLVSLYASALKFSVLLEKEAMKQRLGTGWIQWQVLVLLGLPWCTLIHVEILSQSHFY